MTIALPKIEIRSPIVERRTNLNDNGSLVAVETRLLLADHELPGSAKKRHSRTTSLRHSGVGSTREPAIQFAMLKRCLSASPVIRAFQYLANFESLVSEKSNRR